MEGLLTDSETRDPSYYDAIREELTEDVRLRVLNFAKWHSKKFEWLGWKVEPEELVLEAIARAFGMSKSGKQRYWDRQKLPNLTTFLIGIVRSIVSHHAEKEMDFPMGTLFHDDGSAKSLTPRHDSSLDIDAHLPKNPEEQMIEKERLERIVSVLQTAAEKDEELGMISLCIADNITKASEIAEATGYNTEKVYTLLRKLRRRIEKVSASKEFRDLLA